MIFLSLLAMTFVFTLYATLHRLMGLNWPKDWSALTFGIRTMKVWLRLSSNDAVVKARILIFILVFFLTGCRISSISLFIIVLKMYTIIIVAPIDIGFILEDFPSFLMLLPTFLLFGLS